MTSQTGKQIVTIRILLILSILSRIKGNQLIKFHHLIEFFFSKFIQKMRQEN